MKTAYLLLDSALRDLRKAKTYPTRLPRHVALERAYRVSRVLNEMCSESARVMGDQYEAGQTEWDPLLHRERRVFAAFARRLDWAIRRFEVSLYGAKRT